jgi:hypothetical protein
LQVRVSGRSVFDTPRYSAFHVLVFNSERMKLLNKHVSKYYTRVQEL